MQKLATKIFIYASVTFGVLGILFVLTMPGPGVSDDDSVVTLTLSRLLMATVFVILPSFALSIAGKYLKK